MKTTTTITLKNDFHQTSVNLHARSGRLTTAQARRARQALCGVRGCKCGDALGTRGPQDPDARLVVLAYDESGVRGTGE